MNRPSSGKSVPPRTRRIGGQLVTALKPSRPVPPLRLQRGPRTAAERQHLAERCLAITFKLQGATLPWRIVKQRAEALARDAIAEAERRVREPRGLPPVIERPPHENEYQRTPGGVLVPRQGLGRG